MGRFRGSGRFPRFGRGRWLVPVAVGTVLFGATVAGASATAEPGPSASTAIGAQQYFFGEVNGNHTNAVVQVFCPGPIGGGRTGPPLANQNLGALLVNQGSNRGFTGQGARAIVATFLDDTSTRVVLGQYGITKPIPTSLQLPCGGTGVVRFAPAPRSQGQLADDVTVTYQNIGV